MSIFRKKTGTTKHLADPRDTGTRSIWKNPLFDRTAQSRKSMPKRDDFAEKIGPTGTNQMTDRARGMPVRRRGLVGRAFLLGLASVSIAILAQTDGTEARDAPIILSLDPRATFLQPGSGATQPPIIINLAAAGLAPGDVLEFSHETPPPGFSYNCVAGPFEPIGNEPVNGVFSGSNTLLSTSLLNRVQDAIDVIPNVPTGASDIPEDFALRFSSPLEIPAGATHLFVGTVDSVYSDNCVPGNIATFPPAGAITATIVGLIVDHLAAMPWLQLLLGD